MNRHIKPLSAVLAPYAARREAYREAAALAVAKVRDDARGAVPFGRRLALREPCFDRSNRKGD